MERSCFCQVNNPGKKQHSGQNQPWERLHYGSPLRFELLQTPVYLAEFPSQQKRQEYGANDHRRSDVQRLCGKQIFKFHPGARAD